MKVQVERLSNVEVKVVVEIPADEVEKTLAEKYREVARDVAVRGFRKGKAPRAVLEARFGREIEADTTTTLVSKHFVPALTEAKVDAIGEPRFDVRPLQRKMPLEFTVYCDLAPEFEPQGYRELHLPPLDTTIDDAQVDSFLDSLLRRHATVVPEADGATADTGSVLTVDYEGAIVGEVTPPNKAVDTTIELGAGRDYLPGFEDAVRGMSVGELREFELPMPEEHESPALAGKTVRFSVTAKALARKELPALDDEFARDQGADDLAALRERVRGQLAEQRVQMAEEMRWRSVLDQLIERNPIEIPTGLLASEIGRRREALMKNLESSKLPAERLPEILAEEAPAIAEAALRDLRIHFLTNRIAEVEKLVPTDADIDAHIKQLAERTHLPEPRIRAMFGGEDGQARLRGDVLERKVRDQLLSWASTPSTEAAPQPTAVPDTTPAEDAPATEGAP